MSIEPGIFEDHVISAIRIRYEPDGLDPARVFRSMTKLIEAFSSVDRSLVNTISVSIRPVHLLHDVESGSLIAWLKTTLEHIPDDSLKGLDWKPILGQFLVTGKHKMLNWLNERDTAKSVPELEGLRQNLLEAARETDVAAFPQYSPIPLDRLLGDLEQIGDGLSELSASDAVELIASDGTIELNRNFRLSKAQIESLLTEEIVFVDQDMILLIKKPDYLGTSMWQFHHEGHNIEARMDDQDWLERFQSRQIDVRPGDSIRARVNIQEHRSKSGATVSTKYKVTHVHEVKRGGDAGPQLQLTDGTD